MKTLIVGGTWDLEQGKESGLVNKIYTKWTSLNPSTTLKNGGNYYELEKILDSTKDYEVVFWLAHVDNNLPKVREIKKINPYAIVIGSKRNDGKYTFVEVLDRTLKERHNLSIQFTKTDDKYKMLVFDPLGTSWYDGFDINECTTKIYERVSFITTTSRKNTYKTDEEIEIPNNEEFFEILRESASIFHKTIEHATGVTRFLGNGSFISNDRKYIYATRRDVDKEFIDKDHFVGAYLGDDGKTYYSGEFKPSKDTIVQLNLYQKLKNINSIIHSHCYVKSAPFTDTPVPCGALEEITEVMNVIKKDFEDNKNLNYYAINLIGHGCLIMANNVKELKQAQFITRHLPEKINKED